MSCARSCTSSICTSSPSKDPSTVVSIAGNTPSSPPRTLTPFELTRYLDYCSEMVSLTAKVAVLFGQVFPDPAVNDRVSDLERIAAGLSQKVWQKIMIVEMLSPQSRAHAAVPGAVPAAPGGLLAARA